MNSYTTYSMVNNSVDEDNKPKMLLVVLQGVLDKISIVKAALEKRDYEKKYIELSKIQSIIEILNSSLDMSKGEISNNLASIYDYLGRQLKQAHLILDDDILNECKAIVKTIYDGFSEAYAKEMKTASVKSGNHQSIGIKESKMV
ncbi:MAG: flagellar export chaperone FliS [Proteobacteria bacterium]|nr:flagellar export chaperone FliS [Pseudomonadota bacterium]